MVAVAGVGRAHGHLVAASRVVTRQIRHQLWRSAVRPRRLVVEDGQQDLHSPKKERTAVATASTSASVSSGWIGSDRNSLAHCSARGNAPAGWPKPLIAGWSGMMIG